MFSGVLTVEWCTGSSVVYWQFSGVLAVQWCTENSVVY